MKRLLMKSANINRFMRSGLTILYQMISFGFHVTLLLIDLLCSSCSWAADVKLPRAHHKLIYRLSRLIMLRRRRLE